MRMRIDFDKERIRPTVDNCLLPSKFVADCSAHPRLGGGSRDSRASKPSLPTRMHVLDLDLDHDIWRQVGSSPYLSWPVR